MPPAVFEPEFPARELHQKHSLDRADTGIGSQNNKNIINWCGENMETVNIAVGGYLTTLCKSHVM